MKTTLTGKVRMRVHQRAFGPELLVAQIEEKVERKIDCAFLSYDSVVYRWRDATASEWTALVDTHEPVIQELKRIGSIIDEVA